MVLTEQQRQANAKRQAAYKAKRSTGGDNGDRQLNQYVTTATKLTLTRLAKHHKVTERAMLERLILDAGEVVQQGLTDDELENFLSITR